MVRLSSSIALARWLHARGASWRAFFFGGYDPVMEPADSIRRLGFNRWYERQLIEGHAWFVSAFVCMIAIAACVEELAFRGSAWRFLAYCALVLAAGFIGIYGIVRYQKILVEAERIGEQATCPGCATYARFKLVADCMAHCRKCDRQWRLID
jgi:hypothetical protein